MLAFAPLALHAAEADFKGVKINYENAAVTRPDGESGDIVFTFSDPAKLGSLKLPSFAKAWILSVGGGGSGGSTAANGSGHGAGGGGGAGGFVECPPEVIPGGTYSITVGKGGPKGTDTAGTLAAGQDGTASKISTNSIEIARYTAPGGGGGGAESAGRPGASGGGGSLSGSTTYEGGAGTEDLGSSGGKGGHYNAAGGGGGANGVGNPTTKTSGGGSGNGGDGKPSSITCAAGAEPLVYAGGGGGGIASGTVAKGGEGGGGNGAGGLSGTKTIVEDGVDGLGGGGGGGNHKQIGGKGGDGVVIIRLSFALATDPVKPVAPDNMYYTGENIVGVQPSPTYDIEGTANATNAATYHCTVTLHEGFSWSDGTKDVVTVDWTIHPKPIEKPVAPTLAYNKGNQVAIENPDEALVFTGLGEGNNCTNATDAGSYFYIVDLKSANYVWKDVPEGKEREQVRVDWSIAPMQIVPPTLYKNLVFNNALQDAFDLTTRDPDAYGFEEGSVYQWTEADTNDFTLVLNNTEAVTNFVWKMKEGTLSYDDIWMRWSIARSTNEITSLKLEGWKVGGAPNAPKAVAKWGTDPVDTTIYRYAAEEDAAESQWTLEQPTEAGNWFVWAHVPETKNWMAADRKQKFTLWDSPEEIFSDTVRITVANGAGKDFANYPLTLKFREDVPPGFSYARAGDNGAALVFLSEDGTMLPYTVETWSVSGESTVIVYLKTLPKAGTTLDLYWCLREGQEVPAQPEPPTSPAKPDSKVTSTYGTVSRDGKKVDSWDPAPTMTPTLWNKGDAVTPTFNAYKLRSGASVSTCYYHVYDPTVTNNDITTIKDCTNGTYRVVFIGEPRDDWEPIAATVQFVVVDHSPTIDITGNKGDSGRILLMNNDGGDKTRKPVDYQGWYDRLDRDPSLESQSTFWQFLNQEPIDTFNLKPGTESVLWTANKERKLWHLKDCRHGNTYETGDTKSSPTMNGGQNYLPWSSTSRRITAHNTFAARAAEVGQVVMRNAMDAAVYSPCYTNHVGTIYFDAVNGWTTLDDGTGGENYFQIVVEVATETKLEGDQKVPLDENCHTDWDPSHPADAVYDYANITNWVPLTMHPVHVKGTTLTEKPATEKFGLDVTGPGGAKDEFYRIYVPVPKEIGLKPMRFRIRRVSIDMRIPTLPDASSFILLDNILVSYPPMTANLTSAGWQNPELGGKQELGMECATTVDFPSLSDSKVRGQAHGIYYTNDGDPSADPSRFIVAAKLHYRWRYLNQRFDPLDGTSWKSVDLDPVDANFTAMAPFELPGVIGDIEYWYETRSQAPYFAYADYSGCGLEAEFMKEIYCEEVTTSDDRLNAPEGTLASTGTDWFIRLRQGASPYEGVKLVVTGALGITNNMELVGDHLWRALVPIRPEAEGEWRAHFESREPGEAVKSNLVVRTWGNRAGELVLPKIPTNGDAGIGGGEIVGTVDHVANYYEIKFNDQFETWEISRAEYQSFNHWNDARSTDGTFFVNAVLTNGVDDITMKTHVMKKNAAGWDLFTGGNDDWNETFYLLNYKDPGYPKETVFSSHVTPAKWNAYNVSFVSKNLISKTDYEKTSEDKSGIAAKIRGEGAGSVEFTKTDCPQGLENVTVSARVGQSVSFDTFNYSGADMYKKDYVFVVPTLMSNGEGDDTKAATMAAGASVSVIAYYRESRGCYEFRLSRDVQSSNLRGALYKWSKVNGAMVSTRLAEQWFTGKLWSNDKGQTDFANQYKSYAVFISAETKEGSTVVKAGFSTSNFVPDDSALNTARTFRGLVYTDTANPLTSGTYGVGSKDCPAAFTGPRHLDELPPDLVSYAGGEKTMTFAGAKMDGADLKDDRWELNAPVEVVDKGGYRQIKVPNLQQNLELWLQPRPKGDWVKVGDKTVTGYAFKDISFDLHMTGTYNLRLTTGGANVDLAIGSVRQTQWQATDVENIDYRGDQFVYVQGCVQTNKTAKRNEVLLQPARGVPTKAMGIRSPVLDGLGRLSFDYTGADAKAEIWVQVATNAVEYNLTGANGFNFSTKSVQPGEPAPIPVWTTVASYTAADLGASGSKTVYLGWHNQEEKPIKGLFRLFVPPALIEEAVHAATNTPSNVDIGRITVTGVTVTDEPGLSDRSWRGWNVRMIGDRGDGEKRMYLFDTTLDGEDGNGLDCGLNNSVNDLEKDVPSEVAASGCPAIYSPTLQSPDGSSGIGTVTFKARYYTTSSTPETTKGGKVTVWGATRSVDSTWVWLDEIPVDSPVFTDCKWSAGDTTYAAIKLEISDPSAKTKKPSYDRIIIDEVVIGERVDPTLGFVYAHPFRNNLMEAEEIADIGSVNEQPLAGENWGVQTRLSLQQLSDEIDVERGFEVYLSYFIGERPWGYGKWKDSPAAVKRVKLTQVGDPTNLVFRSIGETPDSLVPPIDKGGTVVQFQITAKFWDRGGRAYERSIAFADWKQPDWFYPVDKNRDAGASKDNNELFSPYTVLDTVSPGRAWINEVNWNDGPADETGGALSVTNQFIEICVPSGVDMEGWYLQATDVSLNKWIMAVFGTQMNARKVSANGTNGFEFVVLESPESNYAGGIRDAEGNEVADGTWAIDGPNGSAKGGTLNYSFPFQLELVRPSGIIEHQFVLQGTNEWAEYEFIGAKYWGTNLVERLNADGSPLRFYAGEELSKCRDRTALGSSGVIGGNAEGNPAPGAEPTWTSGLRFTPGHLNEGQIIPEGWFVAPNGTNSWVTLSVVGSHLLQDLGGDTSPIIRFVIPQGTSTNVTYLADSWYELAALTVDGVTNATHEARGGAEWTYTLTPTGQMCEVVATEGVDGRLIDNPAFGLRGSPYAPAVVNWLADKWPDASPEDIRLGAYKGLGHCDQAFTLSLVDMYWLDIPPVPETAAEWANADAGGTNWWLRGGITELRADKYVRTRQYAVGEVAFTNSQVDLKLYISNAVDHVAHAPRYLQGLKNEKSGETYSGRWNSETLQVLGNLELSQEQGFMPFRCFTFGEHSFSGADADKPFTATIEILDPFSTESPGYGYGWSRHKGTGFYFKWALSTNSVPVTIQTLKAIDTYE